VPDLHNPPDLKSQTQSENLERAAGIEPASLAWKACVKNHINQYLLDTYPKFGKIFVGLLSEKNFWSG
jgi:hypothetical protein